MTPSNRPIRKASRIVTALLAALLAAWVIATIAQPTAHATVFRSAKVDAHWDTWCFHHDGTYYTT